MLKQLGAAVGRRPHHWLETQSAGETNAFPLPPSVIRAEATWESVERRERPFPCSHFLKQINEQAAGDRVILSLGWRHGHFAEPNQRTRRKML
jgi:hypothetical protein